MSGNQMILLGGSQAPAVDPFFYSVTSLLHGDGANGAQNNTFLDSSTNNFTITRNGNTTQGSFSPFSQTGWSNFFDGSGDSLTASANITPRGTEDFTIELWYYPTTLAAADRYFIVGGSNGSLIFGIANGGNDLCLIQDIAGTVVANFGSRNQLTANVWNYIAVTRSGNTFRCYINGNPTTTASVTSSYSFATPSGTTMFSSSFAGYASQFRVSRGTARYTGATMTVPTAPTTSDANTTLLTCQSNRFIDNSTNAYAITRNGDVSVQPFSPFNPTTAYSTSAVGGSGYFDGSGDYLAGGANIALALPGAFTFECWFYPNSFDQVSNIGDTIFSTLAVGSFTVGRTDSATGNLWGIAETAVAWRLTSSTLPTNRAWNHIVAVRNSGNTLSLFLNGTRIATTTLSTSFAQNGFSIGSDNGVANSFADGFFADVRLVKGTAVYDPTASTLTVPTAPLTAIANTSLLCNFTNAGIFDNAADADYETVGNAQISTSVKKYGTGSIALDGTGDYLVPQSSPQMSFGTGDFTVEGWIYPTNVADNKAVVSNRSDAGADSVFAVALGTTNGLFFHTQNTAVLNTGFVPPVNTWTHFAFCRTAGVLKGFVNGTQVGASTAFTSNLSSTLPLMVGHDGTKTSGAASDFVGYIDDLRISKGVARYSYNFTPPTAEFPNIGGTVTLTADPYFDYTTLLLPGNGTNGAQNNTFLDSSTNNFSITRNGNTTQGTFSPFSQTGWGNYFDGSGDFLYPADNAAFAYGTGDFTVECWVYPTSLPGSGSNVIIDQRESTPSGGGFSLEYTSTGRLDIATSVVVLSSSSNLVTNQWQHVAMARSGSTLKLFINGTEVGSVSNSTNLTSQRVTIGAYTNRVAASSYFPGYISNARLVKGTAVYTSNFTPPTAPLTAITNTSLLTCQSNRFIDNSSNAFAITRNGDVSVQAFSPFNPTAAWSAATNGGSGYFDGSGDYLSAGDQTAFEFGSGDYTVELWWYPTSSGDQNIIGKWDTGGTEWILQWRSAGYYRWASGGSVVSDSSTITLRLNSWNHVAVTKSGTSLRIYTNGTQINTTATEGTISATSTALTVGASQLSSSPLNVTGYMSDVRILKGTAQYTGSTYTVPTAPLTAITNTSLLLNFTNAGIYDATSKNDLETVGNAQISTTQSKFGGSSMYFDGTGDWLLSTASPNLALGSGDFTIETWVRRSTPGSGAGVILQMSAGTDSYSLLFGYISSSNYVVYISSNGSSWDIAAAQVLGAIENDVWVHYALTRYGSTFRTFRNGIQQATWTSSSSIYQATNQVTVGRAQGTHNYVGYMQDVRITKGIARYTSNFTPPTTAFLTL